MSDGHKTSGRKQRITLSLSRDSVRFMKTIRSELRSPSLSAVFEKLIFDLRGRIEMEKLNAKTRMYYDSLTEQAVEEDRSWGAVGEMTLASLTGDDNAGSDGSDEH